MIKLLLNRYVWGGLLVASLLAYLAFQEIRYKDTLLLVQEKDQVISETTLRLSQSLEDNSQLLSQVEASEEAILRYQDSVSALEDERQSLNEELQDLYKENEDVKEVLDIKLPDTILNLLRE